MSTAVSGSGWRSYGPGHPLVEEIGVMIRAGASYDNITRSLGVSRKTIVKYYGRSRHRRNYRLSAKSLAKADAERRRRSEARWRKGARLRMQEGKTNREIAEILGVHPNTVYVQMGPTPKRLGGQRPWDPGMHDRARYLREATDWTVERIADEIGVPRSTVGDWLRGMPCDNR